MSDWWEEPYPGGPMVPVPGFPRPLYPPDAESQEKTPSVNGPDAEAYKRTAWRAGRWLGPASEFDRAYSNAFAHGRGGNVSETGIAGIQRQQNIDPTGWIGKQTFNTLRSIRVPEGPHAGEMAMDANAANLIAEAWAMFAGAPPPSLAPDQTSAQARLAKAISHLGYVESPSGSNNTIFGDWYGVNYQPWCAIFCTYCDQLGGRPTNSFLRGSRYAYCPYVVSDARNRVNGLSVPSSPQPGDLVVYDWAYDGTYDHIGIFESWAGSSPSEFTAIEGNTSTSNNSNGGQVMRRTRNTTHQATIFVRVAE